jgi:hypothetical protein
MALGQVALARAAGTEKQGVFPLADESARGQVEHQTAIHLGIEGEVKVVQRPVGIAERSLFTAPLQQALAAPGQFICDQTRDQIDGGHGFGPGLMQPGFQHGGHATEPELS